MCTVSFVAIHDKIIITSNRDEKTVRPGAISPRSYTVNGKNLVFPKDPQAGGTWFAADNEATIVVLLNGANEKHEVQDAYRKSRGLIVLDMLSSVSPKEFWDVIDLENIEPFTLILLQNNALFQLRWNAKEKETVALNSNQNYIWSSSTLYSSSIREKRANWFYTFIDNNFEISESKIYDFHRYTEEGNDEHGLIINRNDQLKTLSITQAIVEKNKVTIVHSDLIEQQDFSTSFFTI